MSRRKHDDRQVTLDALVQLCRMHPDAVLLLCYEAADRRYGPLEATYSVQKTSWAGERLLLHSMPWDGTNPVLRASDLAGLPWTEGGAVGWVNDHPGARARHARLVERDTRPRRGHATLRFICAPEGEAP